MDSLWSKDYFEKMYEDLPITDDAQKFMDFAFAKRNRGEQFKDISKGITPWLHDITAQYLRRGRFPVMPYVIADYYDVVDDKIIATLISCLFVCLKAPICMYEISNLRMLFGEHPFKDFYVERRYTLMSTGENQKKHIGLYNSAFYWVISKVVDSLWETQGKYLGLPLGQIFKRLLYGNTPNQALSSMIDWHYVKNADYRINLLLIVLCTADGIGRDLWHEPQIANQLDVPEDIGFRKFVSLLYPRYKSYGFTEREVASLLGFERYIDLWYCYNAYMEAVERSPYGVSRFMRRYHSQLKHGTNSWDSRRALMDLQPEIDWG